MTAAGVPVGEGSPVGVAALLVEGDPVEVAEVAEVPEGATDVEGAACAVGDAGGAVATDRAVEHAESASSPRSTPKSAMARNGIVVIG